MLTAKRVLVLIGIVVCVAEILSLFVEIVRPKSEDIRSSWLNVLSLKPKEVVRRTFVWYIGGLIFLGVALAVGQSYRWLQLSSGIAGVIALFVGCAGGGFVTREFLWPRFGLSFLTLAFLVVASLCFSRKNSNP